LQPPQQGAKKPIAPWLRFLAAGFFISKKEENMDDLSKDREIQAIKSNTEGILARVEEIKIVDEFGAKATNDLMLAIDKTLKNLETKRKAYVQPLNDQAKFINSNFADMKGPYIDALQILKGKVLGWHNILMQRQEEAWKKQEAERKEKKGVAKDLLGKEPGPESVVEAPKNTSVASTLGKSFTEKTWDFKILDEAKIPRTYLLIDEKKIRQMMRAYVKTVKGETTCTLKIEGVEFCQKESIEASAPIRADMTVVEAAQGQATPETYETFRGGVFTKLEEALEIMQDGKEIDQWARQYKEELGRLLEADRKTVENRLNDRRSELVAGNDSTIKLANYIKLAREIKTAVTLRTWFRAVSKSAMQDLSADDYEKFVKAYKARVAKLNR